MRDRACCWLSGLMALTLLAATVGRADPIPAVPLPPPPPGLSLVTTLAALGPNDWTKWSQLGGDQAPVGFNFGEFSATSAAGVGITGDFQGGNSGGLVAVVCPPPSAPFPFPCSWTGGTSGNTPFTAGDSLIWTFDDTNYNGPLSLAFGGGVSVSGVGLLMQAEFPGQFTAQIQANGMAFTEVSDGSGDPLFIGVTGAPITTSVVFSLTTCTPTDDPCSTNDFAVDTLYTNGGPAATPEPASAFLLASALAGFAWSKVRRRQARS